MATSMYLVAANYPASGSTQIAYAKTIDDAPEYKKYLTLEDAERTEGIGRKSVFLCLDRNSLKESIENYGNEYKTVVFDPSTGQYKEDGPKVHLVKTASSFFFRIDEAQTEEDWLGNIPQFTYLDH